MRILTKEAQADRDDWSLHWESKGCTCFISPPCSYCTHPGNPLCQEDDSCWEDVDPVCVDNTGIEDKFDVGIEYVVEECPQNGFVFAYDKNGVKGVFSKDRFQFQG